MLEVRQMSDEEVEQQVGSARLGSMSGLYIDDVLAVVERGAKKLPSYLDLYRSWSLNLLARKQSCTGSALADLNVCQFNFRFLTM